MKSINNVVLLGYIDNIEKKSSKKMSIVEVGIGIVEINYNKDKTKTESIDIHKVTFFGNLADNILEYGKLGMIIHVICKLKNNKYIGRDGCEKSFLTIICNELRLFQDIDTKQLVPNSQHLQKELQINQEDESIDDDIPF